MLKVNHYGLSLVTEVDKTLLRVDQLKYLGVNFLSLGRQTQIYTVHHSVTPENELFQCRRFQVRIQFEELSCEVRMHFGCQSSIRNSCPSEVLVWFKIDQAHKMLVGEDQALVPQQAHRAQGTLKMLSSFPMQLQLQLSVNILSWGFNSSPT